MLPGSRTPWQNVLYRDKGMRCQCWDCDPCGMRQGQPAVPAARAASLTAGQARSHQTLEYKNKL